MMAAYSNFIGFYPFPSTISQFSTALKLYKHGKGSVQFPLNQPLPEGLIVQMLQYRREELLRNA
jgi:uncharacterized protein YdhG (YjbR/CyaY superfamily)